MSTLSPAEALERARVARAAADQAQAAADQAQAAADQIALAASAATGGAIDPTVFRFAIFVLACFVGYYVVWSVTPALHTPLMAVTNAISGIVVLGALLQVGSSHWLVVSLAALSFLIATINIVGGFLVTRRMLAMFQKS